MVKSYVHVNIVRIIGRLSEINLQKAVLNLLTGLQTNSPIEKENGHKVGDEYVCYPSCSCEDHVPRLEGRWMISLFNQYHISDSELLSNTFTKSSFLSIQQTWYGNISKASILGTNN